jgi:hypothetical protein
MKKILTLLIAAGAFVTLHAQSREESRRIILGEPKDNGVYDRDVNRERKSDDRYSTYPRGGYNNSKQYEMDEVNQEYDRKITSIRNNRYLSHDEKARMIRQLEKDRQNRINQIRRANENNSKKDRYNDRNERRDNGKHKGWYKKAKNKNWRKGRD